MDKDGLWRLFFATGLPEAYLALRDVKKERGSGWELPARTAFRPETGQQKQT